MKILLVGNDPHEIGGVANYTRPLAIKFAELGHQIFYFFSGAWSRRYNWIMVPYLRINCQDFPFECAELINSPNWTTNYGLPLIDVRSPATERIFTKYLERTKPDVVHFHSRLGLPSSLIEIASKNEARVFNTIHVYGLICQRRVLIDRDGQLCQGPLDMDRCVSCTGVLNTAKLKLTARIENTSETVFRLMIKAKRLFFDRSENGGFSGVGYGSSCFDEKRNQGMRKRLNYAVKLMNEHVVTNICVSSDVKKTLMRLGVSGERLTVQHIGSVIAEKQLIEQRKLHSPLVIGNIGGVGYYKGTHVLVQAIGKLGRNDYIVKVFGKYEKDYLASLMEDKKDLPITFYGKYAFADLPSILKEVDVMVLPSICNDTAPQTIFESYSGGVPIIASRIGGFTDFIQDGVNGYLFGAGDSDELADRLKDCLDSPRVLEEFNSKIPRLKTITENASELLNLYRGNSPLNAIHQ